MVLPHFSAIGSFSVSKKNVFWPLLGLASNFCDGFQAIPFKISANFAIFLNLARFLLYYLVKGALRLLKN